MGSGALRRIERLEKERLDAHQGSKHPTTNAVRIQEAARDPYLWDTRYTQTYNPHWVEEGHPAPFEHFPSYEEYAHLFDLVELLKPEHVHSFEKSRDMILSMGCVAYLTNKAMIVPARQVLFQTQKEKKAKQLIKYACCLFERLPQWLKDAFPLGRSPPQAWIDGGSLCHVVSDAAQFAQRQRMRYWLEEQGWDLSDYSQPMATILVTLRRLRDASRKIHDRQGNGMTWHNVTQRIERLERQRRHSAPADSRVLSATCDAYTWVTRYTETRNDHWVEERRPSPYEPFPRLPYLGAVFEVLDAERILFIEKSRDMMISWCCVAYFTFHIMKVAQRTALFQTQTEKKAIQLVDYAKCLYRRQSPELRAAFPLKKRLEDQSGLELHFGHGSSIVGIPGGANQIRSYHPWGYLNDESSFQPDAGECYNEALAAVSGKIIFNSSAGPSWYADARRDIIRSEES